MKKLWENLENEKLKRHDFIPFQALAASSYEFLNENFRGAFDIELCDVENEIADISAKGFSEFLRRIFDMVFGESLIKIRFFQSGEGLYIDFYLNGKELSERQCAELSYLAEKAGFSAKFESGSISALIEKAKSRVYSVYALDKDSVKQYLVLAFGNFKK